MSKRNLVVVAVACVVAATFAGCSSQATKKTTVRSSNVSGGSSSDTTDVTGSDSSEAGRNSAVDGSESNDTGNSEPVDSGPTDSGPMDSEPITAPQTIEEKLTSDFTNASITDVPAAVACVKGIAPNENYAAFNDKPTRVAVKAIRQCIGDELATNMAKSSPLDGITVEQAKCVVLAQLDTAASVPSEDDVEAVFSAEVIADFPDSARVSMLANIKKCNVTPEQLDTILST